MKLINPLLLCPKMLSFLTRLSQAIIVLLNLAFALSPEPPFDIRLVLALAAIVKVGCDIMLHFLPKSSRIYIGFALSTVGSSFIVASFVFNKPLYFMEGSAYLLVGAHLAIKNDKPATKHPTVDAIASASLVDPFTGVEGRFRRALSPPK